MVLNMDCWKDYWTELFDYLYIADRINRQFVDSKKRALCCWFIIYRNTITFIYLRKDLLFLSKSCVAETSEKWYTKFSFILVHQLVLLFLTLYVIDFCCIIEFVGSSVHFECEILKNTYVSCKPTKQFRDLQYYIRHFK